MFSENSTKIRTECDDQWQQDKKAKKLAEQRERQAEAKDRRERQRAKAFKAPKEGGAKGKGGGSKDKDSDKGRSSMCTFGDPNLRLSNFISGVYCIWNLTSHRLIQACQGYPGSNYQVGQRSYSQQRSLLEDLHVKVHFLKPEI